MMRGLLPVLWCMSPNINIKHINPAYFTCSEATAVCVAPTHLCEDGEVGGRGVDATGGEWSASADRENSKALRSQPPGDDVRNACVGGGSEVDHGRQIPPR
jgi:hypothetical protein